MFPSYMYTVGLTEVHISLRAKKIYICIFYIKYTFSEPHKCQKILFFILKLLEFQFSSLSPHVSSKPQNINLDSIELSGSGEMDKVDIRVKFKFISTMSNE